MNGITESVIAPCLVSATARGIKETSIEETSRFYPTILSVILLLIVGLMGLIWPIAARPNTETYTIAVIPQTTSFETRIKWTPFVVLLSQETNIKFKLLVPETIPEFENLLLMGIPDIAFMNPYQQVLSRLIHGYQPLVRSGQPLKGIVVIRSDSNIVDIRELNNQQIAFPADNSFGASLYIRYLLDRNFKTKVKPVYVTTHANVYRSVVMKKTIAGGGVNGTFDNEQTTLKEKLRILYETPGTSPHPLSAHPRVPEDIRKNITQTIIKLAKNRSNTDMFNTIHLNEPVRADYVSDYEPLESLLLEDYLTSEPEI